MAKRPKAPRLRRPAGSFHIGQRKPPDPGLAPERISVYLPAALFDLAQDQSLRAGASSVQTYCEGLLRSAIEAEHDRDQVRETEERRGPLEGFRAISDDVEYLAEWAAPRDRPALQILPYSDPPAATLATEPDLLTIAPLSPAAEAVILHAGRGPDDPTAFLPTLRRGEPIGSATLAEVERALVELEIESREHARVDRRVAFALHRLAFEGQILLTDAWPGAFDEWTVAAIRTVQEGVDRVLSGEDIRYGDLQRNPEPHP